MDELAHTLMMRAIKNAPDLVTRKEHYLDMIVCGLLMFAVGFLAAALVIAWMAS